MTDLYVKKALDFDLCIICQTIGEEELIKKPTSHENLLKAIQIRSHCGDVKLYEVWSVLKDLALEEVRDKVTWHRSCYLETTHSGMLKRVKERYERELSGPSRRKTSQGESDLPLTRSKTTPYSKEVCFFCDGEEMYRQPLHKVTTFSAGDSLDTAIRKLQDEKLLVKLSTAVNSKDAHAIDIRYHKKCWANNVSNVLRRPDEQKKVPQEHASVIGAKLEFITMTEITLNSGKIVNMTDLQSAYESICHENNVKIYKEGRKAIKELLKSEIKDIEFHKPKRMNESERVSIKKTRDIAIQLSEDAEGSCTSKMKTLYDAALVLRKSINKSHKWSFSGSLDSLNSENLPEELYCFFRWVIKGPISTLSNDKDTEIHGRAMHLAQSTVSMCLTERQAQNKKSQTINVTREMPEQLAVGLAVHHSTRNKEMINLLHGFGLSVEYNRLLRVETEIEKHVIKQMENDRGLYIPPDIVRGRHIYFAVDNVDFSEDTHDGKRTLHGAAMAIYQQSKPEDDTPSLCLDKFTNSTRSIKEIPESLTALLECPAPPPNPKCLAHPNFKLLEEKNLPIIVNRDDFAWLLARTHTLHSSSTTQETTTSANEQSHIPGWSGSNSLVHKVLPVTRVCALPLLGSPIHEWNTLLTVLMRAQNISLQVVGQDRKTVISLDMALYLEAKRLQAARNDLQHLILRPGELHIVMAMLRTIARYIESSGIDHCWIEAELYGPSTVRQILDGNHVKRGIKAHVTTLQVLFTLYLEAFFEHEEEVYEDLHPVIHDTSKSPQLYKENKTKLISKVDSIGLMEKMSKFDDENKSNPLFQVMIHYMRMIAEMLAFIKAVRTGEWEMHLRTLEVFTKYFFAHDRIHYARMIPLYLAEMSSLKSSDPEIYKEFEVGNWVVNKNESVPFCAIGADHALEHINRSMKVSGGLIGITLNEAARTKFFLIAPELARLAEEAKDMAGLSADTKKHHHELSTAVMQQEEKDVTKVTMTVKNFTNPFSYGSTDLFNIVTKVVMPENVKKDLLEQKEIGRKLFETFVDERIKKAEVNLWSPIKKRKLLTWKSLSKKTKIKAGDKVVELQEDRSLFARMMLVSKSRPEIDIKEAVGTYEFSVVPRSLFSADGTMLYCSAKSSLMHILEKHKDDTSCDDYDTSGVAHRVDVVDGMAELQSLDKPQWITSCSDLADHFTTRILAKYHSSDEVRVIFDRYDVPASLKSATRVRRQGTQEPVYYHITDSTHIGRLQMKKLLAHTKTKMELTAYLSQKILVIARERNKNLVVAWGSVCEGTQKDMSDINSNQEEADTKIILHAVDVTDNGATELYIHSPDTDVFVLAIRRYPVLCPNTSFVTGKGNNLRTIHLRPIVTALGPAKTSALPGFHAFTGADVTGSFSGKAKQSCWKAFEESNPSVISALSNLGVNTVLDEDTSRGIEEFVCQIYASGTDVKTVKELRWILFKKKQAQSERLPPTKAALKQAILRAHYQMIVWNADIIPNPELPDPADYGWSMSGDEWLPVMTTNPPAPKAIIQLVKCGCSKERCTTNRCQCRKANLCCTDICGCSDSENCENYQEDEDETEYPDDDEDSQNDCR